VASIRKEVLIEASSDVVWDALKEFGGVDAAMLSTTPLNNSVVYLEYIMLEKTVI
jgi:hypothetical protein